jgi:hypothetical protein
MQNILKQYLFLNKSTGIKWSEKRDLTGTKIRTERLLHYNSGR